MTKDISIEKIKKLREETQAPVMEVKKALEKAEGDLTKAKAELQKWVLAKAAKKQTEETSQGLVEAYVHNGRVASVVVLTCQTDFVARTKEFKELAHEIAMQVASMNPKDEKELLNQPYIREPQKKIADLVTNLIAKLGENIKITKIARYSL